MGEKVIWRGEKGNLDGIKEEFVLVGRELCHHDFPWLFEFTLFAASTLAAGTHSHPASRRQGLVWCVCHLMFRTLHTNSVCAASSVPRRN